jgi:hypothetical protein
VSYEKQIHWDDLNDDVQERIAILTIQYGMNEEEATKKAHIDVLKEYEGNGSRKEG